MRLSALLLVSVLTGGVIATLTSGEHRAGRYPCRVAVALSGNARSFVNPGVHRYFRRHVLESIEEDGCQVDVFAYAMLEDDVDFLMVRTYCFCCDVCLWAAWVHATTADRCERWLSRERS